MVPLSDSTEEELVPLHHPDNQTSISVTFCHLLFHMNYLFRAFFFLFFLSSGIDGSLDIVVFEQD